MSLILLRFARPQCLAATHLSSPYVGNGLSWPKTQCTSNAMQTNQAPHSKAPCNEGVLRSNSACSMLMSDDLRLPRWGIEPRPSGFRDISSTARSSPLPFTLVSVNSNYLLGELTPRIPNPPGKHPKHKNVKKCIKFTSQIDYVVPLEHVV